MLDKPREDIMKKVFVTVVLIRISFIGGILFGRKFAQNPTIITYQPDTLVVTHASVVCPVGHVCQWKAWDLETNREVGDVKP